MYVDESSRHHSPWRTSGFTSAARSMGLVERYCEAVTGNTKLAERPDPTDGGKREPLIETRGQGGWVVIAPSNGTT